MKVGYGQCKRQMFKLLLSQFVQNKQFIVQLDKLLFTYQWIFPFVKQVNIIVLRIIDLK